MRNINYKINEAKVAEVNGLVELSSTIREVRLIKLASELILITNYIQLNTVRKNLYKLGDGNKMPLKVLVKLYMRYVRTWDYIDRNWESYLDSGLSKYGRDYLKDFIEQVHDSIVSCVNKSVHMVHFANYISNYKGVIEI